MGRSWKGRCSLVHLLPKHAWIGVKGFGVGPGSAERKIVTGMFDVPLGIEDVVVKSWTILLCFGEGLLGEPRCNVIDW